MRPAPRVSPTFEFEGGKITRKDSSGKSSTEGSPSRQGPAGLGRGRAVGGSMLFSLM